MWSVLEVSITKGPEPPGRAVPTVCFGRRLACWPRPCPRHGQLHRGTALEWLVRSPVRRFCGKDLGVAQSPLRQTSPLPLGRLEIPALRRQAENLAWEWTIRACSHLRNFSFTPTFAAWARDPRLATALLPRACISPELGTQPTGAWGPSEGTQELCQALCSRTSKLGAVGGQLATMRGSRREKEVKRVWREQNRIMGWGGGGGRGRAIYYGRADLRP